MDVPDFLFYKDYHHYACQRKCPPLPLNDCQAYTTEYNKNVCDLRNRDKVNQTTECFKACMKDFTEGYNKA